eukprot:1222961-Prymnesium_polylepis.1
MLPAYIASAALFGPAYGSAKSALPCRAIMSAPAVEAPAGSVGEAASAVRVFDGVLDEETLSLLLKAGEQRDHQFTSIYDRGDDASRRGRTIIETCVTSILDEVGDRSRYVEYWWRGVHKNMEAHRDVDEALCRSQRRGAAGVQRCPENGHVLYLDLADELRGPTCKPRDSNRGLLRTLRPTDRGPRPATGRRVGGASRRDDRARRSAERAVSRPDLAQRLNPTPR